MAAIDQRACLCCTSARLPAIDPASDLTRMEFFAILICLILSGLFSGAEIAFFSITESRLQTMVEENKRAATMALFSPPEPTKTALDHFDRK